MSNSINSEDFDFKVDNLNHHLSYGYISKLRLHLYRDLLSELKRDCDANGGCIVYQDRYKRNTGVEFSSDIETELTLLNEILE